MRCRWLVYATVYLRRIDIREWLKLYDYSQAYSLLNQ